jgi:hypothetical protein
MKHNRWTSPLGISYLSWSFKCIVYKKLQTHILLATSQGTQKETKILHNSELFAEINLRKDDPKHSCTTLFVQVCAIKKIIHMCKKRSYVGTEVILCVLDVCADIQAHLQHPTWVIKNWLTTHAPVFQASIIRARTQATRGVRSIRTYFGAG